MTSSLDKILESKRAFRRELASRPVAEKLRMLDGMRVRDLQLAHRPGNERSRRKKPADD